MSRPVTRAELREELASYATKADLAELKAELANHPTTDEMRTALDALVARLRDAIHESRHALAAQLSAEIARAFRAIDDSVAQRLTGFEDKYRDLPARVSRLEEVTGVREPKP